MMEGGTMEGGIYECSREERIRYEYMMRRRKMGRTCGKRSVCECECALCYDSENGEAGAGEKKGEETDDALKLCCNVCLENNAQTRGVLTVGLLLRNAIVSGRSPRIELNSYTWRRVAPLATTGRWLVDVNLVQLDWLRVLVTRLGLAHFATYTPDSAPFMNHADITAGTCITASRCEQRYICPRVLSRDTSVYDAYGWMMM